MRVRLVVNGRATRTTPALVDYARVELSRVADVEVVTTTGPRHAEQLAAEAEADAVVAMGGDGTVNEVVNGLRSGVAFGVVPAGASSVFARHLGLGTDGRRAVRVVADALAAGRTRRVGLGALAGRCFTFSAGLGIDAEVVREVDLRRAKDPSGRRPRDVHFVLAAGRVLRRHRGRLEPRITVTDETGRAFRCSALLVANNHPYTYLGRVPVRAAPAARLELGVDAVVIGRLGPRALWRLPVYALVWPRHARSGDPRVAYLHDARRLAIECDEPVSAQVDGEYLGELVAADLEALPDALDVLVPPARVR